MWLNLLCVCYLLLDMNPIKCSVFPGRPFWRKLKFSLSSGYQLEIASRLGMGVCPLFLSALGPSDAGMFRSCVFCQSLWIHVPVLLYLEALTACCLQSPLSLRRFTFSSLEFPGPWGVGFGEDLCLWLCVPRSLTLCIMSGCVSLCIYFYLLQEEASLVIVKLGTNVWV